MKQIIADHCKVVGAVNQPRGGDWDAAIYEGQLHYRDRTGKLNLPLPALFGAHQADNAALAVAMLRHQDVVQISDAALKAAMGWVQWPGRMQKLEQGPLTKLATDAEIWVDGGHNLSAAKQIVDFFETRADQYRPAHLIIGMLANKDADGFLDILASTKNIFHSLQAIPIANHDIHEPSDLVILAKKAGIPEVGIADNISQALKIWSTKQPPGEANGSIIIIGSLYLVGEVLKANEQLPV